MTIHLKKLSFEDRFKIVRDPQGSSFSSKLVALKNFRAGEILARLGEECKRTKVKKYTSVQFAEETGAEGEEAHFELESELVYINHSCEPNVVFELPGGWDGLKQNRWLLKSLVDFKEGDALSFAYFSTEWDMQQPFECKCGSPSCLGKISGAKYLSKQVLSRYFINEHILRMKQSQSHSSKL